LVNDTESSSLKQIDLSLQHVWCALLRRWRLIIAVLMGMVVVAVLGSYLITPTYRADVLLASAVQARSASGLDQIVGQYRGLAGLAGIDLSGGGGQSMNETLEILRSREFTEVFMREPGVLEALFGDRWDAPLQKWKAGEGGKSDPPSMWLAYQRFNGVRSVAVSAKTNLVRLSIEWEDPTVAAKWANRLVELLNDQLRERAITEAARRIAYLQEQLEQTTVLDRRQMLLGLMENETRSVLMARSQPDFALRVLDRAAVPEEKIAPQRLVIAMAAALLGSLIGVALALVLEAGAMARQASRH
jgi:uncharacterized protein involved in exopolysaccharide biosynthesis